MIRVCVRQKKDSILKVQFFGHADYDVYGSDIVCAAVSSTYFCSVNACYLFHEESILVESSHDVQTILVMDDDANVQKILINMIHCLENLEKKYPRNIKIDKEEE